MRQEDDLVERVGWIIIIIIIV